MYSRFELKKGEHEVVDHLTGKLYCNRDELIVAMFNILYSEWNNEVTHRIQELDRIRSLEEENKKLNDKHTHLKESLKRIHKHYSHQDKQMDALMVSEILNILEL